MFSRSQVATVVAEFFGAAVLTSVILAVGKSGVGYSYFLSTGVALAYFGAVLMFSGTTEGHFNPAVSLGLWSARQEKTLKTVLFVAAQLLGGLAAWGLYNYLTKQTLPHTALTFEWRVFVSEGIAAAVIAMGAAAVVYRQLVGAKAAGTVAVALFIGTVIASLGSNGIGNPAIALGVHNWSWQYVAGPLVGGIIGVNLYSYLFGGRTFALATSNTRVAKTKVVASKTKKKPATKKRR